MEWTKETLENTVILCLNKNHGLRIIEFYKSFGFKKGYTFTNEEFDLIPGRIIGISTMKFEINRIDNYAAIITPGRRLIKLPSKSNRKFPREMMVSDDKMNWNRTIVRGKIKSVHGTWISEIKVYVGKTVFSAWKYAKEI